LIGLPAYLAFAAGAYWTLAAGFVMQPVENHINMGFFNAAKAKLEARPDLIKIGITGSYGKTSTKFALLTILSEKYNVLASPASFNTPMGLSRVINTQLNDKHQVFIAEMGARHVGDIRELVGLVHPKYGLLTSVGPQHLETFGTIQNIANTKYELIDGLPEDGVAFFADDAKLVHELYERCPVEKVLTGINGLGQELRAENLRVTINGSKFDLVTEDGRVKPCTTRLLGRHNISNIVLAASVALKLGLTLDEIGAGIRKIAPVEHRLQLIKGAMTVIDDAFNSNPSGAQEALNVLSGFPQNRIIITPGFVEQGEKEEELNYQFGAQMAGKVDVAILVGKKHSRPIHDGLTVAGFDEANIYVVPNLDEASVVLRQIGKAGDTVLFENDLPDNYNE
ncbi:MAG: UDP-N-acetylmuramoyl-tripeptide--D-alanyl-D-alanine ligase, partial [Clostridia bacterium]|nr:UDP-N-acetylmuramoyl-tripeptide--D-alanyl-D-alanine ligase [Clostridia bacterium]